MAISKRLSFATVFAFLLFALPSYGADGSACHPQGKAVTIYTKPTSQSTILANVANGRYISWGDSTTDNRGREWRYIQGYENNRGNIVGVSGWARHHHICGG